jgi:hypothetical protein
MVYGGILTNYVITKQIDSKRRYQARAKRYLELIMVMIITNLLGSRNWVALENAAAWERISPYNDVAKITTPTLWMAAMIGTYQYLTQNKCIWV